MRQPIPDAWVRRLHLRFNELYGAQKVAAMWGDVTIDALIPAWAHALGQFDRSVIGAAVEALPDRDSAWPPTLPEFVALCREQIKRPEHMLALPVPPRTQDEIAAGAAQMRRIREMLGGAVKRMPA